MPSSSAARRLLLATLVPLAFAACSPSPPPPGAGEGTAAAPGAQPATGAPGAGAPGPYDPKTDPLVNPATLFEPLPADPAQVAEDETLYRTLEGNPSNLNPIFISSRYEFYFASLLFSDGLFSFDKDLKWRVNDAVVERFEESPDHKVYTVKMRPGLKFQDGHPLTAHDVVYTFEQIMDPRVPCPAVKTGRDEIEKVEALDDLTVRITHKKALPTSKWNAGWSILPKHLFEKDKAKNPDLKTGDYYNNLNRAPVGDGPYKFVKWLENDRIELERWEEFPGPKPHFKRMVFRIIPDHNIQLLTFNKGDVDEFRMEAKQFATQTLTGSDFAKHGYKVWWPEWSYGFICWNQDGSNPFFGDVRVRHAMTHACDVKRMVRDLAYGLFEPAVGPYHPTSWMFNPEVKRLEFDLARAEALLDEAGWKVDESRQGWRHKVIDGQPVKFEFTFLIPQGAQISVDLAAIFQEDLKSIGVDMKQQVIEWATFQERIRKHEFQAEIHNWGTSVDPDYTWDVFHSSHYVKDGTYGRNYGGYKSPRVDELFQLGREEFDQARRTAYYREIQQRLYEDQPYTFLWYRATLWGMHQRIRGLSAGPRGLYLFEPAEKAWWVPQGQAKYPLEQKM